MKRNNLFWGLFFILLAALIVLNQFHILFDVNVFKLIVGALMVPIIFKSIRHRFFFGIFFPIAVIEILFADQFGFDKLTALPVLGAALFLSIGLTVMFPMKKKEETAEDDRVHYERNWTNESSDDNEVNVYVKFGGSSRYIDAKNLKQVNIDASFGGMKIFFDHANIGAEEAVIDVFAHFSGIELYIPRNWAVKNQVECVFGGVEEKGKRNTVAAEKTIVLQGKIKLSGISIIYV